ncbi:hypothetical protein D3C81_582360 [compost metagenome]
MNQQFNSGDLCMIIQSIRVPENIGKGVTLVTRIRKGETLFIDGRKFAYPMHYDESELVWVVAGEDLIAHNAQGFIGWTNMAMIRQAWLMKLGDPDTKLVIEKAKEEFA